MKNIEPMLPGPSADLVKMGAAMEIAVRRGIWAIPIHEFMIGGIGKRPTDANKKWRIVSQPVAYHPEDLVQRVRWNDMSPEHDIYMGTKVTMQSAQIRIVDADSLPAALIAFESAEQKVESDRAEASRQDALRPVSDDDYTHDGWEDD